MPVGKSAHAILFVKYIVSRDLKCVLKNLESLCASACYSVTLTVVCIQLQPTHQKLSHSKLFLVTTTNVLVTYY